MKIIHYSNKAEEYGIGTFLFSLLNYQKDQSNIDELAIVFNSIGKNEYRFRDLGLIVYSLKMNSAKDIRSLFRYIKIFKKYDIVNLHEPSPWPFLAGVLLRKKLIYTFHGALGLRGVSQDILTNIFHKYLINKYCFKITFASETSLARYLNGFGCKLNKNRMAVFPYGIHIEKIKANINRSQMRDHLGFREKYVIGTAARMDSNKRLERLLEAFSYIKNPNEFKMIIMGEGDPKYKKELFDKIRILKLSEYVSLIGFRRDVYDVINSMDLFVLPSKNEPFGLALLEAMALGIPCAVFKDGGGAVDIIGESGFVVDDPKELSDVIVKLKYDEKLNKLVSLKVKERASKYDIKYTGEKLSELYEEAIYNA